MLILSRKIGESIRINDNIEITILDILRGQTRIGIQAPREISIHRNEVYNRIMEEKGCINNELEGGS